MTRTQEKHIVLEEVGTAPTTIAEKHVKKKKMSEEFKLESEEVRLGPPPEVERTEEEKLSHRVMLSLYDYWNNHKYLRLGQIVANAWRTLPEYRKTIDSEEICDIFYLPDERLLVGLENLRNLTDAQRECKKTSQG